MPREAGNLREIHSPTSKEFSAKENKDVPKASDSMLTLFCPLLSSLISRCERYVFVTRICQMEKHTEGTAEYSRIYCRYELTGKPLFMNLESCVLGLE